MTLDLHTISSNLTKDGKRVGRGTGTGRGTYAGRGVKGQKARSGGTRGILRRAFKAQLQKMPKLRGFNSQYQKLETVTLKNLENICKDGDVVTKSFLKKKGIIANPEFGVKIVATGVLHKKITIKGCVATKMAMEAIGKVGGTIIA